MRIIALFSIMVLVQVSIAQGVNVLSQQNLNDLGAVSSTSVIGLTGEDVGFDVIGSPYFNEDFESGWVALSRVNDTVRNVQVRYNIQTDALELSNEGQIMSLNPNPIKSFKVDQNLGSYHFVNAEHVGVSGLKGYLHEVYAGSTVSIYLKYTVNRKIRDSTEPYGSTKNYVEYKRETITYFLYDGKWQEIKNKKDFEQVFKNGKKYKVKKTDLIDPVALADLGLMLDKN